MYRRLIKHIIDFVLSLVVMLIASPIVLIVSLTLLVANSGSPFFFQLRPGKNGKIFKIIKFKTMNDRRDKDGNLLPDHIRLTHTGRIVRKLSIDEIPQLLNVLKGEMSLIGPRPLLPEYLPLYSNDQARRHTVRPGITGWAQVNGRNALSWKSKFELDVWYVDNLSFGLDMKIIFRTIVNVLKREGISGEGVETMTKFTGD